MTTREICCSLLPLVALLLATTGTAAYAEEAPPRFDFFFEDLNGDGRYRIACVGDSNTETLSIVSWCDRLPETIDDPRLETLNLARMRTRSFGETGRNGPLQVITALRDPQVDAVIVSFGINDLRVPGKTPEEILAHFKELRDWTIRAGRSFFVTTTAPYAGPGTIRKGDATVTSPCTTGTCLNQRIKRFNQLLRSSFPPSEVIEFHRNFSEDRLREDGIHIDAEGQVIRSKRAAYMLHGPVRCDAKKRCRGPRVCFHAAESEVVERITGEKFGHLRGMVSPGTCVSRARLREVARIGSEISDAEWKIRAGTEVQGRSIRMAYDCRESDECRESGNCSAVAIPGSPGEFHCRPTWQEHCEESSVCREEGACQLENNTCVKGPSETLP